MRGILLSFILIVCGPLAAADPIELAPGLWKIDSEETQNVASDGRIGSRAPVINSEMRCLDEASAWLIPADYADSFTARGCRQQSLVSTPLDFKGVWACNVNGLGLTINMSGEAGLTGDYYSTVMTVRGQNAQSSVNVRNSVTATRTGDCPDAANYTPREEVILRGR